MEIFLTPLIDFVNKSNYNQVQQVNGLDEHRSLISALQLKRILLAAGCDKKALVNKSYQSHIVSATLNFSDQAFRRKYAQWIFSRYSKSAEEDQQIWRNESNVLFNWAQQFNSSRSNLKIISVRSLIDHSTFKAQIKLIGFIPRDHKSKDSRFSFDFNKALKANFRNQSTAQAYYLFEIYEGHNLACAMQRLFRSIIPEAQIRCISVKPGYQDVLKLIPRKRDKKQTPKHHPSKRQSSQYPHLSSSSTMTSKTSKSATITSISSDSVSSPSSNSLSSTAKPQLLITSHNSSSGKSSHHSFDYPVKQPTKSVSNSSNNDSLSNGLAKLHVRKSSSPALVQVASGPFKLVDVSSTSSTSSRLDQDWSTESVQVASNADHKRNVKPSRSSIVNHSDVRERLLFKSWIKSLSASVKQNQNNLNRLTPKVEQHRKAFRKAMQGSANGFKSNQHIQIVSSGLRLLNSHVQALSKALHDNLDVIAKLSTQYTDQVHDLRHGNDKHDKHKNHKKHHKWLSKLKL